MAWVVPRSELKLKLQLSDGDTVAYMDVTLVYPVFDCPCKHYVGFPVSNMDLSGRMRDSFINQSASHCSLAHLSEGSRRELRYSVSLRNARWCACHARGPASCPGKHLSTGASYQPTPLIDS